MCGSVEDRHAGLVSINVIAITEGVHNVQLDVGEGVEGDVDQSDDLIHALQILTHAGDTLPVICHVFSQIELNSIKICKEPKNRVNYGGQ